MKKFILLLILSFTIISTNGNHVFLKASPDMITGTDIACQSYWEELWDYLEGFSYVHIVNSEWIPSPPVVSIQDQEMRDYYDYLDELQYTHTIDDRWREPQL